MRIAIDTNVLIASLTNPKGTSARLVRDWRDRRFDVVASESTVREAELVLGAGWLARMTSVQKVDDLLRRLREQSLWVEDPPRISDLRLKDEGDLRLVEAAVAGEARYVVTTDREFLQKRGYGEVEFVTPEEFVRRLW